MRSRERRREDPTQPEGLPPERLPPEDLPQQGPHQGGRVSRERTRGRTAHANFKCANALFCWS